jgi:hypothetical protein
MSILAKRMVEKARAFSLDRDRSVLGYAQFFANQFAWLCIGILPLRYLPKKTILCGVEVCLMIPPSLWPG